MSGIKYLSKYVNRNPRNLEMLGIQLRPSGNCFERKRHTLNATYKAEFVATKAHTEAKITHHKNGLILTVSTKEPQISSQLASNTDRSAALNVGRILADRLKQSGIQNIVADFEEGEVERSAKKTAFLKALTEGGICLTDYSTVDPKLINTDKTWINYKQYHNRQDKLDEQI
uniref:39S ribosomal protein L18, mitochondrial n=1 Tax=Rhabditophanes sp. KR3021 TaxID=114890 RepID=A0AC35TPR9_9BILA